MQPAITKRVPKLLSLLLLLGLPGGYLFGQDLPILPEPEGILEPTAGISERPNMASLPQVFTPEAASLGEYGKVPVNYFNGLPNITIPLTELKGKNYNLPVYLSYHAGGNKPDEHAGPVGLGWSLRAGGCINRVVNGLKDEYSYDELFFYNQTHHFNHNQPIIVPSMDAPPEGPPLGDPESPLYDGPGLFYNWPYYHNTDWSDTDNLNSFAINDTPLDYEPDEFIVNIDGLNASFYFDGPNGIRIVSQTAEEFSVSYELDRKEDPVRLYTKGPSHLDANLFTYIKTLTLYKGDGVRYTFGNSLDNIEFSYQQDTLLSAQRLVGAANTWYLSQIAYPGGETIDFTYEKHGFPIVKTDVHSKLWVHCTDISTLSGQSFYRTDEYYTNESNYSNLTLTILNPSYLTRVENSMSGDYLDFHIWKTDELESDVTQAEFTHLMGGMSGLNIYTFLNEENYHMGVTDIIGPTSIISLHYRGLERMQEYMQGNIVPNNVVVNPDYPGPKPRLRLDKVCFRQLTHGEYDREYRFSYDTLSLPPSYHSKFTDHWGYYTRRHYMDVLANRTYESDNFYKYSLNDTMDVRRAADPEYMQAEILREITYPTGGVRKFKYEPHTYNLIASCFNPVTQQFDITTRNNPGMAGGLRIKSITDSLSATSVRQRTFTYNNSGILSGKPLYGAIGRSRITQSYQDPGFFNDPISLEIGFTDLQYRIGSERIINQLSPTSGNHVTYGSVTETFADGSSTTYHYSDHTTVPDQEPQWTESNINCSLLQDPVTSMQLGRGLLTGVDYRDSQGNLVRRDTMTYAQPSDTQYLLAISKSNPAPSGVLKRISVNRIAYYHPALLSKTTTTWLEDGSAPITETETYSYNSHRRIESRTRAREDDSESELYTYAEDLGSVNYSLMSSSNNGGRLVEKLTLRGGKVTGASLTTWRYNQGSDSWVPDSVFVAGLSAPVQSSQWVWYNGLTRSPRYGTLPELSFVSYDTHGNITEAVDRAGHHSYLTWDSSGMNLLTFSRGCLQESYTYTFPGLLGSVTDSRGIAKSYSYDWNRRLESVCDYAGNTEVSYQYLYQAPSGVLSVKNAVLKNRYLSADGTSFYTEETRYDGFGRKSAFIQINASTLGNNIVRDYIYDNKGRLTRTSTPYTTRISPPPASVYPYSEVVYDSTPLDRITKEYGPGADWRPGDHSVRYSYLSNTRYSNSARFCRRYTVSYGLDGAAIIDKRSFWPAGTLEVLKTTNEDGAVSYSYKDMWGQEVLRREEGLDTYYVYDGMGRLTAVLPPSLSAVLDTAEGSIISESGCPEIGYYAYLYRYDSRGRCIAKRLPGCEWVYFVYDEDDHVVFEQDGNDRAAGRWKFTLTDSNGRECLKGTVSGQLLDPFANPLEGLTLEVSRSYPLVSEGMYGYTLSGYTLSNPEILTVHWWDDYSFLGKWTVPGANDVSVMYVQPLSNEPYGTAYSVSSTGLQTGALNKVLGTDAGNNYLWSVNYYDEKGRVVQSKSNHLTGRRISSRYGYDFAGNLTAGESSYCSSGQSILSECYTYSYDNCGRPLQTAHSVNGASPVILKNLSYDSVGRVRADSRNGNPALNTLYSYNSRDWLISLGVGANGSTFSESLNYQSSADTLFTPRWGGDIALQDWSLAASADMSSHKYRFVYDNHSRLLQARHTSTDTTYRFTRQYTYDNEGNILTLYDAQNVYAFTYEGNRLTQYGLDPYSMVVNLSGEFIEPGAEFAEPEPEPEPGIPDPLIPDPFVPEPEPVIEPEQLLPDYLYDACGNMTAAWAQGIQSIGYNILNLPQQVVRTGTDAQTVRILYSADGVKLKRTVNSQSDPHPTSTRTYLGPLIMEGSLPSMLLVEVGYVTFQSVGGNIAGVYHFFVTDHQGNIRAIVDENGSIEKIYHYDPYGEVVYESFSDGPVNNYKYSGKEWDDKQKAYDFSARMYMPDIARFSTMDPLCEQDPGRSPYLYCAGNPVNLVDPDGKVPRIYIQKNSFPGHAFITTGEGKSTTVYTYGRYGALYPVSSGITMGRFNPTGEGVLGILKDSSAESYLQNTLEEGAFEIYELPNGNEGRIDSFFEAQFNTGSSPTNEAKSMFDNPNYRVIDNYNVFNNNCVTTTKEAANVGGVDIQSESISPKRFGKDLSNQNARGREVQAISDPVVFLKDLLSKFHE